MCFWRPLACLGLFAWAIIAYTRPFPDAEIGSLPMQELIRSTMEAQIMEAYDNLVKLVEAAAEDVNKADGGNKAAGTRVRKAMQEIKHAAQNVRVGVLESRSEG